MGVAVRGRSPVTVNTGSRCGSGQGLPGGWVRCPALRLEGRRWQSTDGSRRCHSLPQCGSGEALRLEVAILLAIASYTPLDSGFVSL